MKGIRCLELNANYKNQDVFDYKVELTFYEDEAERNFIHDIAVALHEKFVVSVLIHDLDTDIAFYKDYFSSSDYLIIEDDPTHPFIACSILDFQGIKSVIENFGYYTLDAYLYWSKDGIDFQRALSNKSDYFFMDYSALSIRQVLDLSLEIKVSEKAFSVLWDILKNQLIPY